MRNEQFELWGEQAAMWWWVAHEILLSALGLFRFSIPSPIPSPSPSRLTKRLKQALQSSAELEKGARLEFCYPCPNHQGLQQTFLSNPVSGIRDHLHNIATFLPSSHWPITANTVLILAESV